MGMRSFGSMPHSDCTATHGDGGGRSISYEKGRAVPDDDGELVAAFTSNHGWFWCNRGQADVTLVLRTRGAYSNIKRVKYARGALNGGLGRKVGALQRACM